MHLKNNFTELDRTIWMYHEYCADCNSNQGLALHHVYGRTSSSILNSIPLCMLCHKKADVQNQSTQGNALRIKYLAYTLGHAIGREQYELVERDYKFLKMIPEDVQKARSMI